MNNLHRELAPISDAAWTQIEEETKRTLKRYLAGRGVVDGIPRQTLGSKITSLGIDRYRFKFV
jgi:uncharacterized linocin/CFP29 family protein